MYSDNKEIAAKSDKFSFLVSKANKELNGKNTVSVTTSLYYFFSPTAQTIAYWTFKWAYQQCLKKIFFHKNVYNDVVAHVPNFQLSASSSSLFSAIFLHF